ncbi:GyrI-like domain-containing protein [Staphylococcus pasteuri]|uniref:GyrI-like domain-containing protein n=1 Tax=Staphylococcus TaxID=1279 RepID=UPI0002EBA88D|nr:MULTISPECIES: effector binding domain-containing protein [Staphylococcus]RQX27502.1 AraC family transcriptional regulator [Staphylococcus warneri]MBL3399169.1 GyrI-like domain-containing protein [Staphylococcus pasteuri]MBM6508063.1 GyrI-like domain-containing protein [Staphylococcus pasteuri]MCE3022434.1 GyrI-like domain-containing protein [Staphylococcus pasteuri]MEB6612972.1 GyrI-like domain-containing protein [Staphylococcus pasteuri]
MNYQIKSMEAINLIGVKRQFKSGGHAQSNIPDFWEDVTTIGLDCRLSEKSDESFEGLVGLCIPQQDGKMNYMIGVPSDKTPNDGLETYQLEDNDYLVVNAVGKVPYSIRHAMRHIHNELLPKEHIQLKQAPFFELYPNGDTQDDNYVTELWLPIEQNK